LKLELFKKKYYDEPDPSKGLASARTGLFGSLDLEDLHEI